MILSHRYVQSVQQADVPCYNNFPVVPPAGLEEPNQVELLLIENERLRQELETHREKTGRIQKVKLITFPQDCPKKVKCQMQPPVHETQPQWTVVH